MSSFETRPCPRSWPRFPPIAGVSDMAGTGGGSRKAARSSLLGLFQLRAAPEKSQNKAGGSDWAQTGLRIWIYWRRPARQMFHPGHSGSSDRSFAECLLSSAVQVLLGIGLNTFSSTVLSTVLVLISTTELHQNNDLHFTLNTGYCSWRNYLLCR